MIYKEETKVTIADTEVSYYPPSLAQMPYVMQWIVQGLAPTFLTKDQIDAMTSMQIFEEAIKYITELSAVEDETKHSIWGAALVTSEASISYLFPVLRQCFPNVELELVRDDVLNELMSLFFTDYFNFISASSN